MYVDFVSGAKGSRSFAAKAAKIVSGSNELPLFRVTISMVGCVTLNLLMI